MTLKRLWWIVGFVLVGVVLFFCLIPGKDVPSTPFNDKINHFLAHFALAAWFAGLALGRTTAGLQELGTFCLRYQLETQAYVFLLTACYPRLAPPQATSPAPE